MEDSLIEVFLKDNDDTAKFTVLSLDVKAEVIALGLHAHAISKTKLMEMKNADWSLRLTSQLAEKEAKIGDLLKEIESAKCTHDTLLARLGEQTKATIEAAVASEAHSNGLVIEKLEKRNALLNDRIAGLEEAQDQKIERAVNSATGVLKDEVKRLTAKLDMEIDRSRGAQTLNEKSTDKGKHGEIYVQGALNKVFPCGEIEDTHAEPHRGDFIVRNAGLTMMVESKNYKRNVQKGEIDKFYKDIDDQRNSEYNCALLISLSSGISHREDFCFEIRNGIPIMFIHNAASNFDSVRLAFKLFEIVNSQDQVDFGNREILDTFRNTAKTLRRSMIKQKAALDKSYSTQLDSINKQSELLEVLFATAKVSF